MLNTTQPTILVKKSDGTFVRMSLDEIKKKKNVVAMPIKTEIPTFDGMIKDERAGTTKGESVVVTKEPVVITREPVRTTREAVGLIKTSNIKSEPVKITSADAKSLLEEEIPNTSGTGAVVARINQVDDVIKKISFSVQDSLVNRLRSAVQLRLKEVRGEKETRAMVLRSIKDGGLGLTELQAIELEKICVAVGGLAARNFKKNAGTLPMREGQTLPQSFNLPPVPTMVAPNNAFVHDQFLKKNAIEKMPVKTASETLVMNQVRADNKKEEKFSISPASVSRPIMKDVVIKSNPVSPVEEIKLFTLTDFRRLSNDPVQASKRLAQKFINLRDDSILLFWQAIEAWRNSPLFSEYVGILNGGFTGRKMNVGADGISPKEITALIQMEKDLEI